MYILTGARVDKKGNIEAWLLTDTEVTNIKKFFQKILANLKNLQKVLICRENVVQRPNICFVDFSPKSAHLQGESLPSSNLGKSWQNGVFGLK
jgi:hypothetical protein